MRWTVDKIAQHFIDSAEWYAPYYLGEESRRPMPVEGADIITREHYNRLVIFVREHLS